jgi:hypothetical protein
MTMVMRFLCCLVALLFKLAAPEPTPDVRTLHYSYVKGQMSTKNQNGGAVNTPAPSRIASDYPSGVPKYSSAPSSYGNVQMPPKPSGGAGKTPAPIPTASDFPSDMPSIHYSSVPSYVNVQVPPTVGGAKTTPKGGATSDNGKKSGKTGKKPGKTTKKKKTKDSSQKQMQKLSRKTMGVARHRAEQQLV